MRFLTNYELFTGVDIAKRREILSFLRGEHEKAEGIEDIGDMKRKGKVDDFLNTLFDGSPPDRVTGVSVDIAYGASYGHMSLGDIIYEDMRRNAMQMRAAFAALGMIYAMGISTPFKKPVLSRQKPRKIDGNESDLNFRINEEAASNWGTGGKASNSYSHLKDPPGVASGKNFTQQQKSQIIKENMSRNKGVVRSDLSGQKLVRPEKSKKGITPPRNEWQIDHIVSKNKGGTNSYKNAQVLSRKENRMKSDKEK